MIKFLLDWFWHVDDPPDRIGIPGLAILTFTLFAAYMWFNHAPPPAH